MAKVVAISAVLGVLIFGPVLLNGARRVDAVPFDLIGPHVIAVQGTIGTMAGLTLVVDSGTARTIVDRRVAGGFESARRPDVMEVLGTPSVTERALASVISVGPIRVEGIDVLVADLRPQEKLFGRRIHGLLGMDVLRGRCLTIDYEARRLEFECLGPLSQRAHFAPPLPVVNVSIDGRPYRLFADSGSQVIALFRTSIPPDVHVAPDGTLAFEHLTGRIELTRFASRQVLVGGYSIGAPAVFIIPTDQRIEGYDGVLATRWLTDRRFRLDLRTGALSWTPGTWMPSGG